MATYIEREMKVCYDTQVFKQDVYINTMCLNYNL